MTAGDRGPHRKPTAQLRKLRKTTFLELRNRRCPPWEMSGQRGPLVDSTLVSTDRGADGARSVPRRLMIGSGQNVTTHMLPEEGTLTLGRAPDASIRVEDSSVSRLHARLHVGGVIRVEDLASANGTRIGGVRLRANDPTPVPPGQVVEIGSSWLMIANAPLDGSTTVHRDA